MKPIIALFVCVAVLVQSCVAYAQNETIQIYSLNDQSHIGDVSAASRFMIVSQQGDFDQIQFIKPSLQGWVSEEFVTFENGTNGVGFVKVDADALNFRREPLLGSQKITQVYRNYTSRVLARRDGFVQIYAPVSLNVLKRRVEIEPQLERSSQSTEGSFSNSGTSGAGHDVLKSGTGNMTAKPELAVSDLDEASNKNSSLSDSRTHLIAPGDAISLVVFGESDLSMSGVRVPQNGLVSFPLIGAVKVVGLTTAQIERELEVLFAKGYVRNPRLSVSIFSYRPIFIRGEVKNTGSFPYSEGLTIAKAITLAGGAKASAKEFGISLMREGQIVAEDLSVNSLQTIESGDVVSVDADASVKEAESAFIYLHGEVAASGEYEFRPGLTVEKAVVLAGGFTLRASKRKINITRYEEINESGEPTEMRRVKLYTPVKPGDVIKVGASWF